MLSEAGHCATCGEPTLIGLCFTALQTASERCALTPTNTHVLWFFDEYDGEWLPPHQDETNESLDLALTK